MLNTYDKIPYGILMRERINSLWNINERAYNSLWNINERIFPMEYK